MNEDVAISSTSAADVLLQSLSLNQDSHRPLYLQLEDQMAVAIRGEKIKPGSKLPSETAIQRRLKVSRSTVRQALSELSRKGMIRSTSGRGHFVAEARAVQRVEVLQGLGEALAPSGIATSASVISANAVEPTAQIASQLELPARDRAMEIVRVRFCDGQALSLDYSYLPLDVATTMSEREMEGDLFPLIERKTGKKLGRADMNVAAGLADDNAQALLGVPSNTAVLEVTRLVRDETNRPVDFEFVTFRADRYEMALTLSRRQQT